MKPFVIGGLLAAVAFATVVSQFAVDNPDGLEKVATDQGFIEAGQDHAFGSSLFADYATSGIGNESVSLAIAGLFGTGVTLAVGFGLLSATRSARRRPAL